MMDYFVQNDQLTLVLTITKWWINRSINGMSAAGSDRHIVANVALVSTVSLTALFAATFDTPITFWFESYTWMPSSTSCILISRPLHELAPAIYNQINHISEFQIISHNCNGIMYILPTAGSGITRWRNILAAGLSVCDRRFNNVNPTDIPNAVPTAPM